MGKEVAMNLKEKKEGYERVWKEREDRNIGIIISKIKKKLKWNGQYPAPPPKKEKKSKQASYMGLAPYLVSTESSGSLLIEMTAIWVWEMQSTTKMTSQGLIESSP